MIQKKSVILYKKGPAIVTDCGEKYTITFQTTPKTTTGKNAIYGTQKVRDKDIVLLHQGPCDSIETIINESENSAFIQNIKSKILETWELLLSDPQTQSQPLSISELSELALGSWNANQSWAFYKTLTEDEHFFQTEIENQNAIQLFLPRNELEVNAIQQKEIEKNTEVENHKLFLKRLTSRNLKLPDDIQQMQDVESLALGKTNKSKTMKEAGITETIEKAHKLLLDCHIWPIWKNPYPTRWGVSANSATETLPPPPNEERYTVQGTAYAIDSPWSHDPDDAIAFDGNYVWIHIADPASSVFPDSTIDKAARNRGSTLYIPEGAARMLAEESLEDYALGLREADNFLPENDRRSKALSFRLTLDENGIITDTEVLKTLVNVERLTYEQADEKQNTKELAPLFAIAKRNEERRIKAGGINIQLPEVHISVEKKEVVNDNGNQNEPIVTIIKSNKTLSSSVVREFMLLAGEGAAKFAFKNEIPFPFISQEAPDIPNEIPEGLAGQYKLRRCMRSRSVGVIPRQHAGLGISMYSQVTSPLRRYGDLIAHQQLRAFIDKRELLNKDIMLERISAGDAASSASVKAERKSNMHWTLVWLLQHSDWTGDGVIVEQKGKQYVVIIPELALETIMNVSKHAELNDIIKISAGNINIPDLTVTFKEI